jgi:protein-tyrosine phosphatase
MENALAMALQTLEQGVTHMVCTPHIHPRVFNNNRAIIERVFTTFVAQLHAKSINLKLSFGSEVRLCTEITEWTATGELPYIGVWHDKPALLLEMPHSHIPTGTDTLIYWLLKQGIQPIIPHPERNRDILAHYDKVVWLKKLGVLFQVTAGAFTGTFGEPVKQTVWQMIDDNLVSYVASDMHSINRRPNEMGAAYSMLSEAKSDTLAQKLFVDVPKQLTAQTQWH